MEPKPTRQAVLREAARYSGLGCTFAVGVLLFMAAGWLLDRRLGIVPVFSVLGALIGAAVATVAIYRRLVLKPDENEEKERR